jgi:hypothetical protein
MPTSKCRKKRPPKTSWRSRLEHVKTAVLNSLTSASVQRTYDHAIREFIPSYGSERRLALNRTVPPGSRLTSNNATMRCRHQPSTGCGSACGVRG